MTDPISIVSGGFSIAQGLMQLLGYIRGVAGANVISAYFKWDGTRIEGSEKVMVEKHIDRAEGDEVWWYSVTDVPDYVFIRMPTIESCAHELVGLVSGEKNPDAGYWRWVAQRPQGVIAGGKAQPNLKVDFVVVGYRPKALIKHFSSTA